MRTTITISEPLLENAKRSAAERGITVSRLIEDALLAFLAQAPPQSQKPFRLVTVKGRLVNENLDLDRTSALVTIDDESQFRPQH